ncbi:hypothetical protein C1T31_05680 [Hanstruepera neustonica]|uniref:Fibronectin type-III domain-containing protein n=1 Tax=Hanstruepera neustonica TaxID=1445657 RepID=A0A2K1E0N3_9FLAO|nr:fibronectin type III domain-containing protein [Hanstruepera neustonica]PNQ73821.1 hypothetical protein C1T31_05680 [Hanstruepera neustonica]
MSHNYKLATFTKTTLFFNLLLSAVFMLFFSLQGFGQTFTDNTPQAAAETWTVPAGVSSITIECWGAGGAGGGSSSGSSGGSGGGGGGYTINTFTVTVGQVVTYRVGSGGAGASQAAGGAGTNTTVNAPFNLAANGGAGGGANMGTPGAGGTATGGSTNAVGQPGILGTTGNGGNGGDGANGGAGGAGATSGNGNPGLPPGGGGGGAIRQGGNRTGGAGANGQIRITYTISFAPPNDECANAEVLTVNPDESCSVVTSGTIDSATNSGISSACGGTDDDDVWYTFTATSASHTIDLLNIVGSTSDLYIAIYGSDPCSGPDTALLCSDDENIVVTGFTPGATYYVQIYSWSSIAQTSDFDICIGTPPPPPSNNVCTTATSLTVNPDYSCTTVTAGTVEYATPSGVANCGGTEDDDVWYSFVATSTSHRVSILNVSGSTTDMYHAVYDAAPGCGSLAAPIICSDPNTSDLTGLTPGNTYYVQVYTWTSIGGQNTTFDICVGTPPACTTPITPAAPITFGTITDSLIDGTFPPSVPAADNYLVLINTTGTPPIQPTDGVLYPVGDTSLGATVIDDDSNVNFTATGLTQNTTYFFYVFAFNNDNCGGGPLYSTPPLSSSATTIIPTYCIPESTTNASSYYIDDFTTSGGSTNITHTNSGFSGIGYGDFTGMVVTQLPASNVNFNMTFVGGTFETNIWVDWNNDLDFNDANELVFQTTGYSNPTAGSFTVLASAVAGDYRMRVRSDENTTNPNSCFDNDRSETHDYTLRVSPLNCTADPISVVASATSPTSGTISWTAPAPPPGNGYEYIVSLDNTPNTPGGDITGTTFSTSVTITGLSAGTTYYVFVRGDCNGTDQGLWQSSTFSTGCTTTVSTPTLCGIIVDEAGNDPFNADPFDADPTAFIDCNSSAVTLEAHANLRETTDYIVEQIQYPTTPPNYEFTDGLGTGTNQGLNTSDDTWAGTTTSIGFDFQFYGNCYSNLLVGANGMVTFDLANNFAGTGHDWVIDSNLPGRHDNGFSPKLLEYTIFGVMHDIYPVGAPSNSVKTRTIGTAPCRQFQITYHDIPMFGDSSRTYTGMIVLHETTNIIEVFIEQKLIENGNVSPWNDGNAIVAIQGNNVDSNPGNPANEYVVAPCRNSLDPNWETFNEAWRFTPDGAVIAPNSVDWVAASSGASVGSGTTLSVTTADTYTATSEYTICGNTVTLTDDIVVTSSSLKLWNGSVSTAWTDANNWTPAAEPDLTDCVLIPQGLSRYPIIDGTYDNAQAGTLTIQGPTVPGGTDYGSLLILAGGTLTVNNDVIVENEAILELEGVAGASGTTSGNQTTFDSSLTANLIQNDDSATNSGEITIERHVYVRSRDYVYWSSPVENWNTSSIYTTPYIYEWIPTIYTNATTQFGNWSSATNTIMDPGKGYIIRGPSGNGNTPILGTWNSASFTGVPHNGIYQPTVSRGTFTSGTSNGNNNGDPGDEDATAEDDNWNLLGNPYPSGLSADDFLFENAVSNVRIDGVVYLWQHGLQIRRGNSPFFGDFVFTYDEADYLAYNYSGSTGGFNGTIGSGQGFFVYMEDSHGSPNGNQFDGTVTFNNSMRVGSDEMYFRQSNPDRNRIQRPSDLERHRIWLSLVQPSDNVSTLLVGYIEGATMEKDRMFDAGLMSGSSRKLYSIINDDEKKYVIQGRALPFDESDTIPLGIIIDQEGEYAINLEDVDGLFDMELSQNIFIEDLDLGIIHNIKESPYFFTPTEMGEFTDRFRIRFTTNSLGVDEFTSDTIISIIAPNSDYIKINSTTDVIDSVVVYDILGRNLMSFDKVNEQELIIENSSLSDGVLMVKVTLANGAQKIQKLVLRQ